MGQAAPQISTVLAFPTKRRRKVRNPHGWWKEPLPGNVESIRARQWRREVEQREFAPRKSVELLILLTMLADDRGLRDRIHRRLIDGSPLLPDDPYLVNAIDLVGRL